MEVFSMLCGSLDGRGVWGRIDTYICMAESLCCSLETITTLLIGYECMLSCFLFPTLCDCIDCSPPGSSVQGILRARTVKWSAMSSSRDLLDPEVKPTSPVSPASPSLQAVSLPTEPHGKTINQLCPGTKQKAKKIDRSLKIVLILRH